MDAQSLINDRTSDTKDFNKDTILIKDANGEAEKISDPSVRDVFTIDEAVEKLGFGFFQILITVFCGLIWVRALIAAVRCVLVT